MRAVAKFSQALLIGAFLCGAFLPTYAIASTPTVSESLEYLKKHQEEISGGLIEDLDTTPSSVQSAWGAIAFAAAGYDPASLGSPSLIDYASQDVCGLTSATDIERSILLASASGNNAHTFGGCDLVAKLDSSKDISGAIGPDITSTVFGVLAYSSMGKAVGQDTIDYITAAQQADGGWNSGWGTEANLTAQTINALALTGLDSSSTTIISAKQYLKDLQLETGGIRYDTNSWSTASDAFSDAYTLQAIYALGELPTDTYWTASSGATIIDDLTTLANSDGSYDFSSIYGAMNPVYTTAVVVPALEAKPLGFAGTALQEYNPTPEPDNQQTEEKKIVQPQIEEGVTTEPSVDNIDTPVVANTLKKTFVDNTHDTPETITPADSLSPTETAEVKGAETQTQDQSSTTKIILLSTAGLIIGIGVSLLLGRFGLISLLIAVTITALPLHSLANQAAVVVRHADGTTKNSCVSFNPDYISGLELLKQAGFSPVLDNGFVVNIDGEQAKSFNDPGVTEDYWSYWNNTGSGWVYSLVSPKYSKVYDGQIDGWQKGGTERLLAATSFSGLCPKEKEVSATVATDAPPPPPNNTPEQQISSSTQVAIEAQPLDASQEAPTATSSQTIEATLPTQNDSEPEQPGANSNNWWPIVPIATLIVGFSIHRVLMRRIKKATK